MGAGGRRGGRFERVHMCMHLWCQHTSRRTGRCAKGCRDSTIVPGTGLVGLVANACGARPLKAHPGGVCDGGRGAPRGARPPLTPAHKSRLRRDY
eukprot:scaffold80576_cov30-Tisochrysis_lutea.AAC.3